jgi:Sulfatase-modifying factor enzyme 1/TIR domain
MVISIGHEYQDNLYCQAFAHTLEEHGATVIFTHGVNGNNVPSPEHISQLIESSTFYIILLSKETTNSPSLQEEIEIAVDLLERRKLKGVLTLLLSPSSIPSPLLNYRRIEIENPQEAAFHVYRTFCEPALAGLSRSFQSRFPKTELPLSLLDKGFHKEEGMGISFLGIPLVLIPEGPFLMGSDRKKDMDAFVAETPQHVVNVGDYWIGKYPVTVMEYAYFLQATHSQIPDDWSKQLKKPDHPVVSISWYDAIAYVQWLANVTGKRFVLPSESQWEKAARGTDGQFYPWGDQWYHGRANTRDEEKFGTTQIGEYPEGISPFGIWDMAGNVWEWTRTTFHLYPYQEEQNDENPTDKVLRGGSWHFPLKYARAAFRYKSDAATVKGYNGMRLAMLPDNAEDILQYKD